MLSNKCLHKALTAWFQVWLSALTHNHAVVGTLHNIKRELAVCSQDVKEDISSIRARSGVSCRNSSQENNFCWKNWFKVFISLIETNHKVHSVLQSDFYAIIKQLFCGLLYVTETSVLWQVGEWKVSLQRTWKWLWFATASYWVNPFCPRLKLHFCPSSINIDILCVFFFRGTRTIWKWFFYGNNCINYFMDFAYYCICESLLELWCQTCIQI